MIFFLYCLLLLLVAVNAFKSRMNCHTRRNLVRTCIEMTASQNNNEEEKLMKQFASTVSPLEVEAEPEAQNLLTPELIAILTVYFVQGALGLARLGTSFFMKDQLHLSPTEVAAIGGITTLPWLVKPLYGFLSDTFPIYGYKRRSYLILSGIFGCLSWLSLGFFIDDTLSTVIAITVGSASVAISDVVVDSIVVEKSRDYQNNDKSNKKGGDLQSLCWGSGAVGGILSAYFSGSLLQVLRPQEIFKITAIFPLLVSIVSLFIIDAKDETATNMSTRFNNIKSQLVQLKELITQPSIYLPVLFLFLWQSTPSPDSALFYFTTNKLNFQPEFLGQVKLISNIAALLGVILYKTWLTKFSTKDIIFYATLLSVPLGLTQILLTSRMNVDLGIPDQMFSLTDTAVLTVLGQVAFMPTLVLAASLCPPGVEGTLFATLMSIFNAAGTLSSELGALLTSMLGITDTNFDNLSLLILVCSLSSLLPLPFLHYLDYANKTKSE